MDKKELLFYDAYEAFYAMAKTSRAFRAFCRDAFGADFSQDGFSNIEQINMILPYIPRRADVHVLDIGCGNGKMLGYLQERTACYIHGFDYSEEAIRTAQMLYPEHADFREGIIGEIAYPEESFDVITSMDTMYFAKDTHEGIIDEETFRLAQKRAEEQETRQKEQEERRCERASISTDPLAETDKAVYNFCSVFFQSTRQPYSYLTGDLDIKIGDKVLVPVGSDGKEVIATVVSTSQHMRITAPYPVDKARKVIKKLDD